MNIFALDIDPVLAAQYHADKHVVKMIVETAQLLCNAHRPCDAPYKRTHYNHRCSRWSRKSTANYLWLCDLGLALCAEYTKRYRKRHKSQDVIEWCEERIPDSIPYGELTDFPQAMPEAFQDKDPVVAYRKYYKSKVRELGLKYKFTAAPKWLDSM